MLGWLVVNHFLMNPKFNEINGWLVDSAARQGIVLEKKTNVELGCVTGTVAPQWDIKPDFVLFWDKDIHLAKYLERQGLRLFNRADAIEACDDKGLTHIQLAGSGIPMPKTIQVPKVYFPVDWETSGFFGFVEKELCYPIVVKESFGSFGQQVYLAQDRQDLAAYMEKIGTSPMLLQQFIPSSKGRDVRVNVVGGEVVASMYRYSVTGDFRANVTNGGRMEPYRPSAAQQELAITVCGQLGLDFAGVDLLFGENEEPVLCEVNSNAHHKNIYDCTGIDVTDYMFAHIKKEMM